jgi:endonuclease/exonuclease/phosphatase family metal-dependent hydrolase
MAPDDPDKALLAAPIDAATPRYSDAWELAHPGRPHAPSVGLYDKQQWPGAPFTFDFIFVSDDLAARVADVAVDARSSASDHQPVLLRLK